MLAATKRCSKCGHKFPLMEFYDRRGNKKHSWCIACCKRYQSTRWKKLNRVLNLEAKMETKEITEERAFMLIRRLPEFAGLMTFVYGCEEQRILAAKIISWMKNSAKIERVELDAWTVLSTTEAESRLQGLGLMPEPKTFAKGAGSSDNGDSSSRSI